MKTINPYSNILEFVNSTGDWYWRSDQTPVKIEISQPEKTIEFGVNIPGINDINPSQLFIFNQIPRSENDWTTSGYIVQFDSPGVAIGELRDLGLTIYANVTQEMEILPVEFVPEPSSCYLLGSVIYVFICIQRNRRKISKNL